MARMIRPLHRVIAFVTLATGCTLAFPVDDYEGPLNACGPGKKSCGGTCVSDSDPALGCGAASCDPCALSGATATCRDGACAIGSCNANALDCDVNAKNGCECAPANGVPKCEGSSCGIQSCNAGFGNCDNRPETGCETDLQTTSDHCGACGRSCNGDVCENGECKPSAIVSAVMGPQDVIADDTNLYFTVVGAGNANGSLQRVAKAGGTPVTIATISKDTRTLLLDNISGDLYFTVGSATATGSGQGNGIFKVSKSAGPNTTPTTVLAADGVEVQQPVGLSTDGASVFWTDSKTGKVLRCAKAGCTAPFTTIGSSGPLARPAAVATDASYAYWITASAGRVFRAPKTGAPPDGGLTDTLLYQGSDNPRDITVEGSNVFWIAQGSSSGFVGRTSRTATSVDEAVKIAKVEEPKRVATDSTHVYVTAAGDTKGGSLIRVPLNAPKDTVAEVLASKLSNPTGVALDQRYVYVAVFGSGTAADGAILRIPH